MIIFGGWGILFIPLCGLAGAIFAGILNDMVFSQAANASVMFTSPMYGLNMTVAGLLAAGLCWFWGRKLNKPKIVSISKRARICW